MSFKAIKWAMEQKLPAMQKIVLLVLADYTNDDDSKCFPSHETLVDKCGMAKRSVINQLEELEKVGCITVLRAKKGSRAGNKYLLNINPLTGALNAHDKKLQVQEMHLSGAGDALVQVQEMHSNLLIEPINEPISLSLGEAEKNSDKPELGQEMQDCFNWAIQHQFWKDKVTSISRFLTLYTNNKPDNLKAQYQRFLQAQKNPLEGNQAGSMSIITDNSKVINYDDYSRKSNTRKLSLVEQAGLAAKQAIERIEREERETLRKNNDSVVASYDTHLRV